ncbi:tetratricopeptide repeat-containing sensor histidine kinase [uncultured Lutibacter sp.]|uniref:tetratricopeptide repeat-containing sensor histidine kinase n=1 Tax=uncultured Lutibacter sp. TaxID=437739 RepID=UPI002612CF5A|nr:tetratricopeptide repeat-containing sensor histidine kinase [uncultured Lutibacter sp.]
MRKIVVFFLFYIFSSILYGQDSTSIKSLKAELYNASVDSTKISIALKIADTYLKQENDSSLFFYNKALETAKNINDQKKIADILFYLGYSYEFFNEHNLAIQNYKEARLLYIELKDSLKEAMTNNYIGFCYTHLYNESKAIDFYLKSLSIYKKLKNDIGIANNYTDIGNLYYAQENFKVAEGYYNDAFEIYKRIGDKFGEASSYTNLGNTNIDEKNFNKGLEFFKKSIVLYKEIDDLAGIAIAYNNIGDTYIKLKEFKKSKSYFSKALELANEIKDQDLRSLVLLNISDLYNNSGNFKEAIKKANESNKIANEIGNLEYQGLNFLNLSVAYDGLGNFKEALNYYKKYTTSKDSLIKIDGNKKIQLFNALNKLEEKELTINNLAAENEITQLKYDNEKKLIYFLIGAVVIFAFLIILFIYEQESKKKAYNLLEFKNYQISKLNNEMQEQRDVLKQMNITKDKFFSIIAHDLKNPFNSIKGFTELLIENINEYTEEKQLKFLKVVKGSTVKASSLLNNLLIWANSQSGNLKFNPQKIDLKVELANVISFLEIQAFNKDIKIANKIQDNIFLYADDNMLSTILRNLISNAIKFTQSEGRIEIISNTKNGFTKISIKDSGIGISEENLKNLFNIETKKSTLGTSNEQGSGLGLILCKEFVERHGGEIFVESELTLGSTFSFTLPNWEKANQSNNIKKKTLNV